MGILKFLRKKGPGSPRRSKKGNAHAAGGSTAVVDEEQPNAAKTTATENQSHPHQDATSSTEPESTYHPEEDEEVVAIIGEKNAKTGGSGTKLDPSSGEAARGSDLEIVKTPLTESSRPNNEASSKIVTDDKSVLEKFKAKSPPVPRGTKVAERTAWLQNTAFKEQELHCTLEGGEGNNQPTSREMAAEKKKFWEGKTFHKDTSSETTTVPIRVKTDVQAKKKWLETVAFTPSGGGNMEETNQDGEDQTHSKRKHTMGLLPSSPNVSGSSMEADSPEAPRHSAKDLLQVMQSMEEQQRLTTTKVFLDKKDDPYEQAYETWFRSGLLSWRTSKQAGADDTVYQSLQESIKASSSSKNGKPVISQNPVETPEAEDNVRQENEDKEPQGEIKQEEFNKEKSVQLDIQLLESEADKVTPPDSQTMSALLSLASSKDAKSYTFASLDSSEDPLHTELSLQAESQSILALNSMDELSTTMVVNLDLEATGSLSPNAVSKAPSKEEKTENTPSDALSSATTPGSSEDTNKGPEVKKEESNDESGGDAIVLETAASYESIDDDDDFDNESEKARKTGDVTIGVEKAMLEAAGGNIAVVEVVLSDDSVTDGAMEPDKAIDAVRRAISMQSTESSADFEITIADSEATEDFIESEMIDSAFVDDDDDEDFKELFQLQQQILHDLCKRPFERVSDSDNDLDGDKDSPEAGSAEKETDDVSETTDSSQKLVDYSKKYFNTGPSKSIDVDIDSVAESGVHLEPSIVSQASSITADEMSFGDGIHFAESLDGRMFDVSMESASFELLNDLQPHKEMNGSSNSKSMLFEHAERKDHSPVQPSRKRSSMGNNFSDQSHSNKEARRHSVDHAPSQPSRKVSVDGQEHLFRGTQVAGLRPISRSPVSSITTSPADHAPARPIRQASVEDGMMIPERPMIIKSKQDSPPTTPVRVASLRTTPSTVSSTVSDSLRKARARKLAAASRGQYVMWLTRSRAINFRKSSSAPQLSWFGFEEERENSPQRSFDNLKQQLRQYISPSRRRTESEALERLNAVKSKLSQLMRRPFARVTKTTPVVPVSFVKRTVPVLTPFVSVPPRLQKRMAPKPPTKPKVQADARWTFV